MKNKIIFACTMASILSSCGNKTTSKQQETTSASKLLAQKKVSIFNDVTNDYSTFQNSKLSDENQKLEQQSREIKAKLDAGVISAKEIGQNVVDVLKRINVSVFNEEIKNNILDSRSKKLLNELVQYCSQAYKDKLDQQLNFLAGYLNIDISKYSDIKNYDVVIDQMLQEFNETNRLLNIREEYFFVDFLNAFKRNYNLTHSQVFKVGNNIRNFLTKLIDSSDVDRKFKILKYAYISNLVNDKILFELFSPYLIDVNIRKDMSFSEMKIVSRLLQYSNQTIVDKSIVVNMDNLKQYAYKLFEISKLAVNNLEKLKTNINIDDVNVNIELLNNVFKFWDIQFSMDNVTNLKQFVNIMDVRFYSIEILLMKRMPFFNKELKDKIILNNNILLTTQHPVLRNLLFQSIALNSKMKNFNQISMKLIHNAKDFTSIQNNFDGNLKQRYLKNLYSIMTAKNQIFELNRRYANKKVRKEDLIKAHQLKKSIKELITENLKIRNVEQVKEKTAVEVTNVCIKNKCNLFINPDLYVIHDQNFIIANEVLIAHPLTYISFKTTALDNELNFNLSNINNLILDIVPYNTSVATKANIFRGKVPVENYSVKKIENHRCYNIWLGATQSCYGTDRYAHKFLVTNGARPQQSQQGISFSSHLKILNINTFNASKEVEFASNLVLAFGGNGGRGNQAISSPLCSGNTYHPFIGRSVNMLGSQGNNTANISWARSQVSPLKYDIMAGQSGNGGNAFKGVDTTIRTNKVGADFVRFSVSNFGGLGGKHGSEAHCSDNLKHSPSEIFGHDGANASKGSLSLEEINVSNIF